MMLRPKPTVISLTAGEVKDAETRRRFRKHLRNADAQQSLEQKLREQSQESPCRERSSSTPSPRTKNRPEPTARRRPEGVLTSSPPQSPAMPVQQGAAAEGQPASANDSPRHGTDDESAGTAHEPSHPFARLFAMTPRRLPPALLSASSLRRGSGHGRPGGAMALPPPVFAPWTHRDAAGERAADSEITQQTRHPMIRRLGEPSPPMPPPFSQTPRRVTAEFDVPRPTDVDDISDSEQEAPETSATRKTPPATPIRRSSLRATIRQQAFSDNEGTASLPGVPERAAETVQRDAQPSTLQPPTRQRSDVVASTQSSPGGNGQAEASTSSPSARLGRLQIYNDSLPPSVQPETPQNLPEARHQSRLRGSYTVQVRHESPMDIPAATTGRRWQSRSGRNPTPVGLQTPGFLGLYGGIENGDEAQLFEQAQRELEARHSSRSSSSFGV